ncbi:MAG: ParB/RepB/Spo0J family partition protein [Planctomycetes bacterium]|nr:ParB/RepB/Spo0J family partition protein [Planctomycetota bacterium]
MSRELIRELPIDGIACFSQVREAFDEEPLHSLAQSISEHGVIQPLLVRAEGDHFVVVDGERRLRAAKLAGLKSVPAIVTNVSAEGPELVALQLVCAVQREDLTPTEKAKAIDRIMREASWTAEEAAKRLGLSPPTVTRLRSLLLLPDDVKELVDGGQLAASTAYEIARTKSARERAQLIAQAKRGKLTRECATRGRVATSKSAASKRQVAASRRGGFELSLGPKGSILVRGVFPKLRDVQEAFEALLARLRALANPDMNPYVAAAALRRAEPVGGES